MMPTDCSVRCTPTILSTLRSVLNMCHWHIAPQYSHIVGLSSHFYVYAPLRSEQNEHPLDVLLHIGAGPKVFHPPMSKLMWI